ncbi:MULTISPECIES: VOC family protein [Gordonia]|uniref:VOC family protein n=1 Tax=Gordonia TaxID=2053 RepID=UPI0003F68F18|nr:MULTISPECIES: VOC family protein [Gordonia]ATD71873.1 glyoxalase/bleomycin resistance/dioxygenase family protein [Gordonia sp. 1D]MCZ4580936.1 VOC family protein [Gordonia amicalis]MDJ0451593.1 VOC family protein [Gordonia amicalis]MDV7075750.1 VOC family protein [Gordonia amicalis]UKO91473.1 VOC family protein [Gordonia amicalis]
MEVLSSRVLLLSADPERLQAFYRDQLGLPIHREYTGGIVFFAGNGLIEISSHMKTDAPDPSSNAALWLQVRDAEATEKQFRDCGVSVTREPRTEPWGLIEMHAEDPDGRRIIVVEIPADHPLRKDTR